MSSLVRLQLTEPVKLIEVNEWGAGELGENVLAEVEEELRHERTVGSVSLLLDVDHEGGKYERNGVQRHHQSQEQT